MSKIDFKKTLKHLYRPSAKCVVEVDVHEMQFLVIDGTGGPEDPTFQEAIEALYSVSYTLKFIIKKGDLGIDYGVLPLEGLWWADEMNDFIDDNKSNWEWRLMIMQPDFITRKHINAAIATVREKKQLAAIDKVEFALFHEGRCSQTLHVGPFSEEGPTVQRVHQFIKDTGAELSGKHHEIYLSDIRRAAPENWKTIIRQPMR
ncbi:GyrI-like domain-containing protein [Thaumasiovibrio sp. DFM-14]|uniref:GyrI-like domain-containing protein n=1 Tax=Thaumasiovibrio sp. DFM-14 TaxID=3384792 RepID=UPI0039A02C40